jgi:hypothetical protein
MPRFPRSRLISQPQPYGLFTVFGVLAVLMALVNGDLLWRKPPMGILALTTTRDLKAISFDPWLKPLVLRIDAQERWFLDGEPVTPEDFPAALKKSLSRRPDWFVYLEADPNLDFRAPARAMDMIQGLHAKVILMAPTPPRATAR